MLEYYFVCFFNCLIYTFAYYMINEYVFYYSCSIRERNQSNTSEHVLFISEQFKMLTSISVY